MSNSQVFSQLEFLPVLSIETGSRASLVAIGDMNHDGREDVVLATAFYFDTLNDYKVFVFLQNEEGQLIDPVKYSYPDVYPGINTLAVGDVNHDGFQDIIIGYSNTMGIYFQNDTGSLNAMKPYILDPVVSTLKTGDLNNDGLTDIAVAVSHWSDPYIRVFYQTPTGFETEDFPKPTSSSDEIEIGDVNHDGLEDVVLMNGRSDDGIYVFLQNNNGLLDSFHAYIPGQLNHHSLHGIGIGDLNNDNAMDIAVSKGGNIPVSKIFVWYEQPGLDTLPPYVEIPAYEVPSPVEIYDLNCDGKNEIISGHSGWDAVTVYQPDSAGLYNSYLIFDAPTNGIEPQGLSIGDINDDGRPDIVVADFNEGLGILLNNSTPVAFDHIDTFSAVQPISTDTIYEEHYFIIRNADTLMNYQITQIDSFGVQNFFHIDSFKIDSVLIRNAIFCSRPYIDTLIQVQYLVDSIFISGDTTFISTHTDSTLLTSDYNLDPYFNKLNIYPNPTDKFITLQFDGPASQPGSTVRIFDNKGTLLIQHLISASQLQLDISDLPGGIYYVQLMTGDRLVIKKLIITKGVN